ncbi:MAG: hypothetical protein ACKV19_16780 [Verrucomicrobiales bacterium]
MARSLALTACQSHTCCRSISSNDTHFLTTQPTRNGGAAFDGSVLAGCATADH